jgi:hypothetical protein
LIYAVRAADGTGPVKFGFTDADSVEDRLAGLQTGSPVPLACIATSPGTRPDEARLHRELRGHRLHGEWFSWCVEVASVVATMEPYSSGAKSRRRLYETIGDKIAAKAVRSESGCWLWPGTTGGCILAWRERGEEKILNACRASYEAFVGTIHEGWVVTKTCGKARCVNPEHLSQSHRPPGAYRPASSRGSQLPSNRGAGNGMNRHPERRPAGDRNGMRLRPEIGFAKRRLTDEQAREIRESGEPIKALARRFGVGPKSIKSIREGRTYRLERPSLTP